MIPDEIYLSQETAKRLGKELIPDIKYIRAPIAKRFKDEKPTRSDYYGVRWDNKWGVLFYDVDIETWQHGTQTVFENNEPIEWCEIVYPEIK